MSIVHKLVVIGLLFVAVLVTGMGAGNSGKPSFAVVHKLLAVVTVILLVPLIWHSARPAGSRMVFVTVIVILGMSILALFVTGSLLTTSALKTAVWLNVHRVASAFAVIAMAVTAKLFILGRQ